MTSAEQRTDDGQPADQRDRGADRPRDAAALDARGVRVERDRDDERDDDEDQQRRQLPEEQPASDERACEKHGAHGVG
jgi:hypothetical protein